MTDVTFVRTRYQYDPYNDFFRLAELSGYPVCYIDEMDIHDPSKCYVIAPRNGEWGDWSQAQARLIWWQLEWEAASDPCPPGVAEKWTSDAWHARKIGARFVPLGSHPGLNPGGAVSWQHDAIFLGYSQAWRRGNMLQNLHERGLHVNVAGNTWGDNRHNALLSARIMLHIHQHDNVATIAPLRWAIAAAYRMPLYAESMVDPSPFGQHHFMRGTYNQLPDGLLKARDMDVSSYGAALYEFLCIEKPFRSWVEGAL
jgi:hypothetical protein